MTLKRVMLMSLAIFVLLSVLLLVLEGVSLSKKNEHITAGHVLREAATGVGMAALCTLPFFLVILLAAHDKLPYSEQELLNIVVIVLMVLGFSIGLAVYGISQTAHQYHVYRTWPDKLEQLTLDEIVVRLSDQDRLRAAILDGRWDCLSIVYKNNSERLSGEHTEVLLVNAAGTVAAKFEFSGHQSCEAIETKPRPTGIVSSGSHSDYQYLDVCTNWTCSRGVVLLLMVGSILLSVVSLAAFSAVAVFVWRKAGLWTRT